MGDSFDLDLKADILSDVFKQFIKMCLECYKLDPCQYFRNTGLSWDAMLKMKGFKLDLISDIVICQFREKGMKRGVSTIYLHLSLYILHI